jgi:hypothetical protein
MVVLVSLLAWGPAAWAAEAKKAEPAGGANVDKVAVAVGSGVLGLVLASGIIQTVGAGVAVVQGAGMAEALEAAGLPLPVALLSVALGVVFGQDLVTRLIASFKEGGGHAKPAH